jgi:DHA3 family macrolide efflux protein-like MFS transporter
MTPLHLTRSFGEYVSRLTAIEITFSIGMVLGGIIIASWGGFKNKVHTMVFSTFFIGICTLALGVVSVFWLYLAVMVLTGIAIPIFNTPSMVLLQQKVEEEYLGRVFGIFGMISSSMMPFGMLLFGPLADLIRIEWLLIGTGLLLSIQSFFMLRSKVLVEAGKPVLES